MRIPGNDTGGLTTAFQAIAVSLPFALSLSKGVSPGTCSDRLGTNGDVRRAAIGGAA